jgi:hypothetical protein
VLLDVERTSDWIQKESEGRISSNTGRKQQVILIREEQTRFVYLQCYYGDVLFAMINRAYCECCPLAIFSRQQQGVLGDYVLHPSGNEVEYSSSCNVGVSRGVSS